MTFSSAFEEAALSGGRLRDMLQGIAQDISRIILRQTVTEPLAGITSPVSQAGSFIGGLFGGGGATAPSSAPAAPTGGFLTLGGPRATGGPVGSGHAYLVGEEGAELSAPGISGSIVQ